jgi:uncharacterized membrane protein YfcA
VSGPVATFILAGIIIFAAHVVGGVTGFGTAVLGLPLLALLVGLDVGKQSLLLLSTFVYLYIVIRHRTHIDWRQLAIMVAFATIGLPLGLWVYETLPLRAAMISLGAFITAVGLRNLLQIAPDTRAPRWVAKVLLVIGGAVHGAFTTGGPLLIVYGDQTLRPKATFRATLSLMWLALNALLAIVWTWRQHWLAPSFRLSLLGLPFMLGGLVLGERLHHVVSEMAFRKVVNITLIAMGLLLILIPTH